MANTLAPNEILQPDGRLISTNGRYVLLMQLDGNLVLYRAGGDAIWASGTDGHPMATLGMQSDGNAVIYHDGVAVWASATDGHRGAHLTVCDDGRLAVVDATPAMTVLYGPDPEPAPTPTLRPGRVRLEGRCQVDDQGTACWLGASLFWAVRGARAEPDRLRQNLRWLRERGVDFVRVLAETTDWPEHLRTDATWPDYITALRTTRDMCAEIGLRVQWTVFGGNALSIEQQNKCLTDVLTVCDEKPATVQYIEISNEDNGFKDSRGAERMRYYANLVRAHGYVTALTSAQHANNIYEGSVANLGTVHFQRQMNENGWRPVRQPWGYPGEYPGVPVASADGERIGPGTSVASDTDVLRLAMGPVYAWLCGMGSSVVHFGAGIYGYPMTHETAGFRPANVWEQEALEPTLASIIALRKLLPVDMPNWERARHGQSASPFDYKADSVGDGALKAKCGAVRAGSMFRGGRYVTVAIGVMRQFTMEPAHAQNWVMYDGLTGVEKRRGTGTLVVNEDSDGRAVVVVGEYR